MDLAKYLPLSQRPQVDESAVTSNWSEPASQLLLQAAAALFACRSADWSREVRPGVSVTDVARGLVSAAGTGKADRRDDPPRSAAELASRVQQLAAERKTGRPRTRVTTLGSILTATYDLGTALGVEVLVDPSVTGAVALARAVSGPLSARTIPRVRTLVATDHLWRIGHGPDLAAPARIIVQFLYGSGDLPREPGKP